MLRADWNHPVRHSSRAKAEGVIRHFSHKSHELGSPHRGGEDDQPAQNTANVSAMVIAIIKWMMVTSSAASDHFLLFDWFGDQLDPKRSHDLSNGIEFGPRCFLERFVEALSREPRCL